MMYLEWVGRIRMDIDAKRSLGQNFLKDENILKKIASSIETCDDDLIIEIGPGMGALTKYLKEKGSYLVAFEIDERMHEYLDVLEDSRTRIIYQDVLKSDILDVIKDIDYQDIYVIANIPYYITTPIIKKLMDLSKLKSMSLLMQKEVAERIDAKPGSKAYGSLSVYLSYYFDIKRLFNVGRGAFRPTPNVDSAVVNFTRKENRVKVRDEEVFFKLVKDAFRMKRKTLKNNLDGYDWGKVLEVLEKNNYNGLVRAEEIPLDVFIEIANSL